MKKSINNHKGFTLAELMVCLAIISVIATLLMPAINALRPNKNKVMFKKAYYLAERIVAELVNDEEAYPFVEGKFGFDELEAVTINSETYQGNSKFCRLFAVRLNTLEDDATIAANCNATGTYDNPTFTTTDGIEWGLPVVDFSKEPVDDPDNPEYGNDYYSILVDVNGAKNPPNCEDNPSEASVSCTAPDRYIFYVRTDGKMKVDGFYAKKYLGETNMIENKK